MAEEIIDNQQQPGDNLSKYYNYLKSAGADVPNTVESFKSTLSNKDNGSKYFKYLKDNKFDTPDTYESFNSTLGIGQEPVKEKKTADLKSILSIPSTRDSSESTGTKVSGMPVGQKPTKEEKKAPVDLKAILSIPSTRAVGESTKGKDFQLEIEKKQGVAEAPKRQKEKEEKIKQAKIIGLKNTTKRALENDGFAEGETGYMEGDANWKEHEKKILDGIQDGTVALTTDKQGNPYYVPAYGPVKSLVEAVKKSFNDEKDSYKFWGGSDEEKVNFADNLLKDNKVPSGVAVGWEAGLGEFAGGAAEDVTKGVVGGLVGTALGAETGPGAVLSGAAGAFLAMAPGSYTKGYTSEIIKRYKESLDSITKDGKDATKEQKLAAMRQALPQGRWAGGVELVKTGALSFIPGGGKAASEGFGALLKNYASHTAKDVIVQGALSSTGEAVKDIAASANGYNVSTAKTFEDALNAGSEGMKTALAFSIAHGAINVPKYVKAGALDYLSTIKKSELISFSRAQEANGKAPVGTTEKLVADLDKYNNAKSKVPSIIPENKMATFAGHVMKKNKLQEEKLKSDPSFHEEYDKRIAAVDKKIKSLVSKDNVVAEESDDVTGAKGEGVPMTPEHEKFVSDSIDVLGKNLEDLKQKEGIVDTKEYQEAQQKKDLEHAKTFGFDNQYEALNSVEKRTGVKYDKYEDIPEDVLKTTSEERGAEKQAQKEKDDFLNKAADLHEINTFDKTDDSKEQLDNHLGFDINKDEEHSDEQKQTKQDILDKVAQRENDYKISKEEEAAHNNADEDTATEKLNQTEQQYDQDRNRTKTGEPASEIPEDVLPKSTPQPDRPSAFSATFEQAGFRDEESARAAFKREQDNGTGHTYEEFLHEKYCG